MDGRTLPADLVIDASGRSSRFTDRIRPPAEGGDCGAVYVTRQYRLHDGATAGPMNSPIGLSLGLSGYWAIAFLHDNGAFSITFTHDGTDKRLRLLRHDAVFDDAVRAIPLLADWIDSSRAQPIRRRCPAGGCTTAIADNSTPRAGRRCPGLISVGDAVCTTTPLAGRGVALALMQARELVRILSCMIVISQRRQCNSIAGALQHIRPWFEDHRYTDADRMRRWSGGDVDVSRRLPSDLIVAAAEADPQLKDLVGPYVAMDALPASLHRPWTRAREIYAGGWRPPVPDGPTREQLSSVVSRTPAAA